MTAGARDRLITPARPRRGTPLALVVVVLALMVLGVASAAAHLLLGSDNPGLAEHPEVTWTHVVLGAVYLAFGSVQFCRPIRNRFLGYHRWAGRALAGLGIVVGTSALFIGLVVPYSGDPERVVIGAFGTLFLVSLILGVTRVRQDRIAQHREWMIRAYAIGLSIATMRLFFIPALILVGDPSYVQVVWLSVGSFTAAFAIHAAAAELLIRRTR